MNIQTLAVKLNVDPESAQRFADVMVSLRMANRTNTAEGPTYTFHADLQSFDCLISSLAQCGARA